MHSKDVYIIMPMLFIKYYKELLYSDWCREVHTVVGFDQHTNLPISAHTVLTIIVFVSSQTYFNAASNLLLCIIWNTHVPRAIMCNVFEKLFQVIKVYSQLKTSLWIG